MEQHFVRRRTRTICKTLRLARRGDSHRLSERPDFLLGRFQFRFRDNETHPVAPRSMFRHARLRLFLQHGFSQLLRLHWPRLFFASCFLAKWGRELAYGGVALAATSSCASARLPPVRTHNHIPSTLAAPFPTQAPPFPPASRARLPR